MNHEAFYERCNFLAGTDHRGANVLMGTDRYFDKLVHTMVDIDSATTPPPQIQATRKALPGVLEVSARSSGKQRWCLLPPPFFFFASREF